MLLLSRKITAKKWKVYNQWSYKILFTIPKFWRENWAPVRRLRRQLSWQSELWGWVGWEWGTIEWINLKRSSEESKNSQTWKWCRSLSCVVFPISSLKSAECTAFSIVWENIIRKTQKLGLIPDLYFWQAVLLKTQCYQAQSATQTEDGKAPLLIPWK